MSDTAHQSPLGVNTVGSLLAGIGFNINPTAEGYMGKSKSYGDYTFGSICKDTVLRLLTHSINQAYIRNPSLVNNTTYNNLISIGSFTKKIGIANITSKQNSFTVAHGTGEIQQVKVGTYILIQGANPDAYNGIWIVKTSTIGNFTVESSIDPGPASTPGSFSYQTSVPALGNSMPFSFTWEGNPGWGGSLYKAGNPVTQWGFIRLIALQAWQDFDYNLGLSATGMYQDFVQQFQNAYSFIEYQNQFILSANNSRYFLQGTYSNMDDLTTGDLSGVSLATQAFGSDLVTSGRAIDLSTIETFGLPSNLLYNLEKNNALTKSVTLALFGVGFTTQTLSDVLANKITLTKQQEAAMYTAFTLILGPELTEVLVALNCQTEGLESLADLLNVKKLFPKSYESLTVPVYNPNPNLTPFTDNAIDPGTTINPITSGLSDKDFPGVVIELQIRGEMSLTSGGTFHGKGWNTYYAPGGSSTRPTIAQAIPPTSIDLGLYNNFGQQGAPGVPTAKEVGAQAFKVFFPPGINTFNFSISAGYNQSNPYSRIRVKLGEPPSNLTLSDTQPGYYINTQFAKKPFAPIQDDVSLRPQPVYNPEICKALIDGHQITFIASPGNYRMIFSSSNQPFFVNGPATTNYGYVYCVIDDLSDTALITTIGETTVEGNAYAEWFNKVAKFDSDGNPIVSKITPVQVNNIPLSLPGFNLYTADYTGRTNAGTSSDPVVIGVDLFPGSTWYPAMNNLTQGSTLTYPNSNYYNTVTDFTKPYWTLIVNNEPTLNNDSTHTGAPSRSQALNSQFFYLVDTGGTDGSSLTFKLTQDGSSDLSNIPYMGYNTLGSGCLTGKYGDNIVISYDLTPTYSNSGHVQLYEFLVFLQLETGEKKNIGLYLGTAYSKQLFSTLGTNFPFDLQWNWRLKDSVYYPGGLFRFYFPVNYNPKRSSGVPEVPLITNSGATYHYEFYLDDLIKVIYPEYANTKTRILGIEFSIEQAWTSVNTITPSLVNTTQAKISNLKAYKQQIVANTPVPAPPPPPAPTPPTTPAAGVVNSKIYYPIYGTGSITAQVSSSSLKDNVKAYTPTILPTTSTTTPTNTGTNISNNYYSTISAGGGGSTTPSIGPGSSTIYNSSGPSGSLPSSGTQGGGTTAGGQYYWNGQYFNTLPGGPNAWNIYYPDPNGFVAGPSISLPAGVLAVSPKDPNFDYTKATNFLDFSNYAHDREYFALEYFKNDYDLNELDPLGRLPNSTINELIREAARINNIVGSLNLSVVGTLETTSGGISKGLSFNLPGDRNLFIADLLVQLAVERGYLDANGRSTLPPDNYQLQDYQNLQTARQQVAAQIERKLAGTQPLLPGETVESLLRDAQKYGIVINTNTTNSENSSTSPSTSGTDTSNTSTNSPSGSTVGNATQNNTAFPNSSNPNRDSVPIDTGSAGGTDGVGASGDSASAAAAAASAAAADGSASVGNGDSGDGDGGGVGDGGAY